MDLAIIETGNGGDLQYVGRDLAVIFGIENQVYLALFGGNVEASTEKVSAGQAIKAESFDYWANNLLLSGDKDLQFNSETERTLNTVALTSEGRVSIEDAVKRDLEFLKKISTFSVTVTITDDDRVNIDIKIQQDVNIKVITINFKKASNGDWFVLDFNSTDFFI